MSYTYWNNLLKSWAGIPLVVIAGKTPVSAIAPWTNPNAHGLLGSAGGSASLAYIPEPWWGNDGHRPLEAVVMNYNPGAGGPGQLHGAIVPSLLGLGSYAAWVNAEVAAYHASHSKPTTYNTSRWHFIKRAVPIFNALSSIGFTHSGTSSQNLLSVELIPWHTSNIKNIGGYISANLRAIYDHSICFAAAESRRIKNPKLKNKVLIRASGTTVKDLFNQMQRAGILNHSIVSHGMCPPLLAGRTSSSIGGYLKVHVSSLPDIEFIAIWGTGSRNNFPPSADMDYIFKHHV